MNERDAVLFVVDDDAAMRRSLAYLFDSAGWRVSSFESAHDFLARYDGHAPGCLVLDVRMPLMSGLELQQSLKVHGVHLPTIFLTGHGDLAMAVQAMKAGACDFLEKPCKDQVLLDAVTRAVQRSIEECQITNRTRAAQTALANLTAREREVAARLLEGLTSKEIGKALAISHRTVEIYRARLMRKYKANTTADLVHKLMAGS